MTDFVALKIDLRPLLADSDRSSIFSPGLVGVETKAMRFNTKMTAAETMKEIAGKIGIREDISMLRLRVVRLGIFMEDDTPLMSYFLKNGDDIEVLHKPQSMVADSIVLRYIEEMKRGFKPILALRNQKIKSLPGLEALVSVAELNTIDVTHNVLTTLPSSIGCLTQLVEISAHHNEIEKLPRELFTLPILKRLFLQFNSITVLPDAVGQLGSLEQLNMRNNLLRTLPASLGRCSRLTEVMVSGNPLPGTILDLANRSNVVELRKYLVSATQIPIADVVTTPTQMNASTRSKSAMVQNSSSEIQPESMEAIASAFDSALSAFDTNTNSQTQSTLQLPNNKQKVSRPQSQLERELETGKYKDAGKGQGQGAAESNPTLRVAQILRETMNESGTNVNLSKLGVKNLALDKLEARNYNSLRTMALNDNKLSTLSAEFSLFNGLVELTLEHNLFEVVPPVLMSLDRLQVLKLGHNRLTQLPGELSHLRNLVVLTINDNLFDRIPPVLFGMARALKTLKASSCPFADFVVADASKCGKLLEYMQDNDSYVKKRLIGFLLPKSIQMMSSIATKFKGLSDKNWKELPTDVRTSLQSQKTATNNLERALLRLAVIPGYGDSQKACIERTHKAVQGIHATLGNLTALGDVISQLFAVRVGPNVKPATTTTTAAGGGGGASSSAPAPAPTPEPAPAAKPAQGAQPAQPSSLTSRSVSMAPSTVALVVPAPNPNKPAPANSTPTIDQLKQRIMDLEWDGVASAMKSKYKQRLLQSLAFGLKKIISVSKEKGRKVIELMVSLNDRDLITYVQKIAGLGVS